MGAFPPRAPQPSIACFSLAHHLSGLHALNIPVPVPHAGVQHPDYQHVVVVLTGPRCLNPGIQILNPEPMQGSTFGIKGVEQHAHFLREVSHAREIRDALLSNWNLANIPGRQREERLRLLHTIVVGGGPTGEFWFRV